MESLEMMLPELKSLRLSGFLETLEVRNQQAIEQRLSHLDFLKLVVADEQERRETKKLSLRLRKANFPTNGTLERFQFDVPSLKLNRSQIFDLATCRFVADRVNVIIVGPTGVGKSHIAQAIGHKACRLGWDVVNYKFYKALAFLRAGKADGSYERRLQSLVRPSLLILDDFGLKPMTATAEEDLHELVTERYERSSIIITSNLDLPEWGAVFPNQILGAATVDRLRHGAHLVVIEGESFRKPEPPPQTEKAERNLDCQSPPPKRGRRPS